jgi:uncharacterized protein YhfF
MKANLPEPCRNLSAFAFGDSPEMADHLLSLVIAGNKTATCGALRDYGDGGEAIPVIGDRYVVLDGKGQPAAVIETVDVAVRRFHEVDAVFARQEGEGDLSPEQWRSGHEAYFRRKGDFSPDMELVCERFRLVDILERNKG